ncbi:MAG: sulfatase [Deltaproteobacteria bacterium]|nr:sulfatase [Deltaproteobacteria bacterium]
MDPVPSRAAAATQVTAFAALGAGGAGLIDAARVLAGSSLHLRGLDQGVLLLLGGIEGAALGALAGLLGLAFPGRPHGRSRWLGALLGVAACWALRAFVVVFTDPAPFTTPAWWQGSPLAFAAALAGVGVVAVVLYQGVRGANAVVTAALLLAAGHGVWAWSARRDAGSTSPKVGRPSVVVVTLDTVRADHFGALGNRDIDTRHFDRVAREGTLFTAASAVAPVTGPSHAAMLTGTGPWENGVLLNGIPVPPDREMLAERLADEGYATGAFVSAFVLEGGLGFARGFSVYDDEFSAVRGKSRLLGERFLGMLARRLDPDAVLERRGADTVDLALAWEAEQASPYFLWVHLFDAHGPYTPPPPYDTRYYSGDPRDPAHTSMQGVTGYAPYLRKSLEGITDLEYVLAQYRGEVSYADAQLGRLMEGLDLDNTLLVVMGDHGESLGEHGQWFDHGDDVYETSVHVPFAMRWPGHVPVQRVDTPVDGTDLAPTVLAALGLSREGTSGIDALAEARAHGASMTFDRAANQAEREAGRITQPRYRMASLRGLSSRWVHAELDGKGEYFELASDARGEHDVAPATLATPEGAQLLDLLRRETEGLFEGDTSRSAAELSPEDRAMLEQLGYLEQ